MASPFLQYGKLSALASIGGYEIVTALDNLSAVFLLSACCYLQEKWLWQSPLIKIDDSEYQNILNMIAEAEARLMISIMIGTIVPSISVKNEDALLLCDGSSVLQSDYPELAAIVPSSWLVGSDIVLPDLRDVGLFGSPDAPSLGTFFGENTVTLDESTMPSHTHIQNPHQHTEIIPVVTPSLGGEIPALADLTVPTPSTTGFATATNQSTGGGGAHNNVQNSMLVYWYLVAR